MSVESESITSNPSLTKFTDTVSDEFKVCDALASKLVKVSKSDLDTARQTEKA